METKPCPLGCCKDAKPIVHQPFSLEKYLKDYETRGPMVDGKREIKEEPKKTFKEPSNGYFSKDPIVWHGKPLQNREGKETKAHFEQRTSTFSEAKKEKAQICGEECINN